MFTMNQFAGIEPKVVLKCKCGAGRPQRGLFCMRMNCRPEGVMPTKAERQQISAEERSRLKEKPMPIHRHVRDMTFVELLKEFITLSLSNSDPKRMEEVEEALETLTRYVDWERK